jgi:hypothetical protein
MCDLAVLLVDVDAAAISLRVCEGCEELVAASDPWAQALEELQYTLGEGPGVEALVALRPVMVTDVRVDGGRGPGFANSAAADGLVSVFAFPIGRPGTRLGTLDLYRRRPGELPTEQLTDAAMLADLAMFTLMGDIGSDENLGGVRDGTRGHYDEVHMAVGMLAAHLGISVDEASVRLRAHAFGTGRTLLDVAHAVISRQLDGDSFLD